MYHLCCPLFCLLWHVICFIMCCIAQRDISALTTDDVSVVDSSLYPERTHNTELTDLDHMNDNQHESYSEQVSISMSGEDTGWIQMSGRHSTCVPGKSESAEGCPHPQFNQHTRGLKRTFWRLPESLLGVQTSLIYLIFTQNSLQYCRLKQSY